MQFDDPLQERRLSLDITPLIDVVFLLVLFFAVSSSFISAEDLSALRSDVDTLARDKLALTGEVQSRTQEVSRLQADLLAQTGRTRELDAMVALLERQRVTLRDSLEEMTSERRSLQEQLEQAFSDYAALNLQLEGLTDERDRYQEQERALRALLAERETERLDLQRALDEAEGTLKQNRDLQADYQERERLLQSLLAEKAAEYADLQVQLVRAGEQNRELDSRLQTLEADRTEQRDAAMQLRTEVLKLQAELAKYRAVSELDREQIERLLEAQRNLRAGLETYLRDNRLNMTRERDRLVLQLSDRILFASGSATINTSGMDVLRTFGAIIKGRSANLDIQIGGHTDDVPLTGGSGLLATNWGLSAARAVNVVRFLEEQVGLDPLRLSAVGYGEHRPIASNATAQGRASNRRIEIVLVPR